MFTDMDLELKALLDTRISELEERIVQAVEADGAYAETARILRSVPGIGPVASTMLIAQMPGLGAISAEQAAALTGLAPIAHDSGPSRGERTVAGGRRALRHALFQVTLVAALHKRILKAFAQRLRDS